MIEPLPIYMQMRFLFLQNTKKTFLCISRNIFQFFFQSSAGVPFITEWTFTEPMILISRAVEYIKISSTARFAICLRYSYFFVPCNIWDEYSRFIDNSILHIFRLMLNSILVYLQSKIFHSYTWYYSKFPFLEKRTDSPSKRKSVIPHIKPPEP